MSDYTALVAEARSKADKSSERHPLYDRLAAAVEQLQAERQSCHELLDEFFEHPKNPAELLDHKLGRLITDAMTVLAERDAARKTALLDAAGDVCLTCKRDTPVLDVYHAIELGWRHSNGTCSAGPIHQRIKEEGL
jgi:hypothetical protein